MPEGLVQPEHWFAFAVLVVVLLALDLFVFHRHDHTPSLWESALLSAFWIGVGLAFNGLIWWWGGHQAGVKFLSGYLIEKSLSMDNVFVFVVIFRFFHVPMMYQYRVLFWGILGAIVMRLAFILGGIALLHHFEEWGVAAIFGAFLVYTAYKLARHTPGSQMRPERNFVLRIGRRFLPVSDGDHHQHGHAFLVREAGHWCITPMFLVLLVIESTDVVFAVDSVPAIIGITHDRFIAFTSNIFAILGLRALYFLLAGVVNMFRYLHYGLAAVLGFVGLKMISEYLATEFGGSFVERFHEYLPESVAEYMTQAAEEGHLVPAWASLLVIATLLGIATAASLIARSRERRSSEGEVDT